MVRGLSLLFGAAVFAIAIAHGCNGDVVPLQADDVTGQGDSGDPCTDPATCCKEQDLVCTGNPDTGVICSCRNLWECSYNPTKCTQPISPPDGSGGWACTNWNEFSGLTCEKTGSAGDVPTGVEGWNCQYNGEQTKIVCTETEASNPTNNPSYASAWNCVPTGTEGVQKLVCEKKNEETTSTSGGGGNWTCPTADLCTSSDTLPPGGSAWKCHEETIAGKVYNTCTGTSESNPGGSNGWTCVELSQEFNKWICHRPKGNTDQPPAPTGGGAWSCRTGSEFSGTECVKVAEQPQPPTGTPKEGEICIPGALRWCDGLQFCGWGVMTCEPDGTWPTKVINGKTVYDCQEREDGRRPNTDCACYHYYFNPKCCESPDCMIPAPKTGTGGACKAHSDCPFGQLCAEDGKCGVPGGLCEPSDGSVCDYCNPQKPNCQQGICAVSNAMETFCTTPCVGANRTCPTGMTCMAVKTKSGETEQCIPSDFSCYNGL